ncbi:hypothetical protein [Roseomonas fluvialis]|uniref:Argininosuccinate lyase n=1 Tax=Roseomonas fluvialis TaxID=1750527 RepID=A0ABM7Y9X6_9PROT|nr:hypothetical protein [Roseomonas fluvialis]BDG74898.1 hypothetical protein Rmf_48270 [Roseomonas fluvialis]
MEEEEIFTFTGPSAQDFAHGTAILASALVREAESLACAAAGLRATLDLFTIDGFSPEAEDRRVMREGTREGAALAGALLLAARQLLRFTGDPARAAHETVGRLPRGSLSVGEVVGHLRAAALAPVTDDGAARIAAATIAETFAEEFDAAWRKATPPAVKGTNNGL